MKRRELVNLSEAARRLGLPRTTVANWAGRDHLLFPIGLTSDGVKLYDLEHVRQLASERRSA